jgi:hypothetical protein
MGVSVRGSTPAQALRVGGVSVPELRRDFWSSFKRYMEDSSSVRCARATSDGWMWHNADLTTGNLLSMIRVRLGEMGVKYTLNDADADTVFSFLRAHREVVEAGFERALTWRPGGTNSHVIEIRRPGNLLDLGAWSEHFTWFRRQLETFQLALWSLVGRVPPTGERRHWDQESFVRELCTWNPASLAPAKAILGWALAHGATLSWGSGRQCGSFSPTIPSGGFPYQMVTVRTDGTIALLFRQLSNSPLFCDRSRRLDALERLNGVRHIALPDAVVDLRPSVPLNVLANDRSCTQFLRMLDWFEGTVKSP